MSGGIVTEGTRDALAHLTPTAIQAHLELVERLIERHDRAGRHEAAVRLKWARTQIRMLIHEQQRDLAHLL